MIQQPETLINIFIVLGESFWIFSAYAQLRKLRKTRDTKGLSAITITLNAAGNIAWCRYFGLYHLWFPFIANVMVLTLSIGILAYILSDRTKLFGRTAVIIVIGMLTSYILVTSTEQSGWLGVIFNWVAATPWLVKVVTTKRVTGISGKSLFFAALAMLLTLTYALFIHSLPLIAGCLQGLLYISIISGYYYRYCLKN